MVTNEEKISVARLMLDPYHISNGAMHNELESDTTYPSIVSSALKTTTDGVVTITSTPGNFLLLLFINKGDIPATNLNGWKSWGGFAPLRTAQTVYQKVWVLTKISTGSDMIEPYGLLGTANYAICYEFKDVKLDDPLIIGCAPILIPPNQSRPISKSCDKFIIYAGHGILGQAGTVWTATAGTPIINGVTNDGKIYAFATVADSSKIVDWAIGAANKIYMHYSTAFYSAILPIAVNRI